MESNAHPRSSGFRAVPVSPAQQRVSAARRHQLAKHMVEAWRRSRGKLWAQSSMAASLRCGFSTALDTRCGLPMVRCQWSCPLDCCTQQPQSSSGEDEGDGSKAKKS